MLKNLLMALLCLWPFCLSVSTAKGHQVSQGSIENIPQPYSEISSQILANQRSINAIAATVIDEKSAEAASDKMTGLVQEMKALAERISQMPKLQGKSQLSYIEMFEKESEALSKEGAKILEKMRHNEEAFEIFIEKSYMVNLTELNKASAIFADFFSTGEVVLLRNGKEVTDEGNPAVLKVNNAELAMQYKNWSSYSSVALGSGYSFVFQTKSAHEFLAEYFQRVFVFQGDGRSAKFSGALQLMMNTGGRTNVLVYRHMNDSGMVTHLTLEDRFGKQSIDLSEVELVDEVPVSTKGEYLGLLSGAAYPNKFITSQVVSEKEARKRL